MTTISLTLQDEIRAMNLIAAKVADAEAEVSSLKAILRDAEQRVIDKFAETETQDITVDGIRYKPDARTYISPAAGSADAVVAWIVENGGADLVKPAMHHKTRDKYLTDVLLDDFGQAHIPPELDGLVNKFDVVKVNKRKVS